MSKYIAEIDTRYKVMGDAVTANTCSQPAQRQNGVACVQFAAIL